jgi:hypothetical protein
MAAITMPPGERVGGARSDHQRARRGQDRVRRGQTKRGLAGHSYLVQVPRAQCSQSEHAQEHSFRRWLPALVMPVQAQQDEAAQQDGQHEAEEYQRRTRRDPPCPGQRVDGFGRRRYRGLPGQGDGGALSGRRDHLRVSAGVLHAPADAIPQARTRQPNPRRVEARAVIADGHLDAIRSSAVSGDGSFTYPAIHCHVAQCLPDGAAERLRRRCGNVEVTFNVAGHVQLGRESEGLAPQRGFQAGEARAASPHLPGQSGKRKLSLGRQDARRQRLDLRGNSAQHTQNIVVHRVGCALFGFLRG